MSKYELTYLTVGEEPADAPSVRDTLAKHEATIESVNVWTGRRKLAYPIQKQDQAFYTTVVFGAEPEGVKPISDALLSNEGILRSLIIHYIPQPVRGGTGEPEKATVSRSSDIRHHEETAVDEGTILKSPAETSPEVAAQPVKPAEEAKPKRKTKKATDEEVKALDEKLEELLSEDITA